MLRLDPWSGAGRLWRARTTSTSSRPETASALVSALIGNERAPVRYNNLLNAVVNPTGLGLSIRSVFGQAPAIFIPWTDVESAARSQGLLANTVLLRLRSQWPTIALYGQAGLSALHADEQSTFKREL